MRCHERFPDGNRHKEEIKKGDHYRKKKENRHHCETTFDNRISKAPPLIKTRQPRGTHLP